MNLSPVPHPLFRLGVALALVLPASLPAQTTSSDDEIVELEAFEIEAIAEGQARAIQQQRDADNIKIILTSDAVGRLPDFSVGEALARMSGVSVQKDRGEPEFITIRGTSPRFNSVALNGDRIPSTADPTENRNDRSVTLNAVPTGLISSIEVTKTLTPDMDGDAIGGAVNLVTRSPLDLDRRLLDIKLEYGRNDLPNGDLYSANFTFGDKFGPDAKFGLLIGASYQFNERAIDEINTNYGDITIFGSNPPVTFRGTRDIDFRYRFIERERQGVNAQLDWEPSKGTRLYVRGFFNEFRDTEERIRIRNRFNTDGRALVGSGADPNIGLVDGYRTIRQDRQGYKDSQTRQIAFGGKHDNGETVLDYALSYAKSRFKVDRVVANWQNRLTDAPNQRDGVADVVFDATDFEFPSINFVNPATNDPARFVIRNGRGDFIDQNDLSAETDLNASLNFQRDVELAGQTVKVKAGYRGRFKETESSPGSLTYERVSGSPTLSLNNFLSDDGPYGIFDDRYSVGNRTDFNALRSAYFDNQALWELDEQGAIFDNVLASYRGAEDINGGYFMGTTDFGPVRVVAGLRYEHTGNDYRAFRIVEDGDDVSVEEVSDSSSYDNFFPGITATWRLREDLLLRAAWTNAIARPNYIDLAPFVESNVDTEDPTLTEISLNLGNPDLKPFESINWDLSLEYYYARTGFVSAGLFYKDISNFEFDLFTEEFTTAPPPELGPIVGAAPNYRITRTRPINGPSATLKGIELAISHKFENLPAPFDKLGVIANATFIDGESELPPDNARVALDLVPDQVEEVFNLQVYWENHRFAARVAWNYNGNYLESLGADVIRDNYVDVAETIDLSFEWKVTKNHKLYFEIKNLTDELTERKYQGFTNKPTLREEAGRVFLAGAKLAF